MGRVKLLTKLPTPATLISEYVIYSLISYQSLTLLGGTQWVPAGAILAIISKQAQSIKLPHLSMPENCRARMTTMTTTGGSAFGVVAYSTGDDAVGEHSLKDIPTRDHR